MRASGGARSGFARTIRAGPLLRDRLVSSEESKRARRAWAVCDSRSYRNQTRLVRNDKFIPRSIRHVEFISWSNVRFRQTEGRVCSKQSLAIAERGHRTP